MAIALYVKLRTRAVVNIRRAYVLRSMKVVAGRRASIMIEAPMVDITLVTMTREILKPTYGEQDFKSRLVPLTD
jgi:hypothetical protein